MLTLKNQSNILKIKQIYDCFEGYIAPLVPRRKVPQINFQNYTGNTQSYTILKNKLDQ